MAVTAAVRFSRTRWWAAALAWALWVLATLGLAAATWLSRLLLRAGRPDLMTLEVLLVVACVSAATVGAVLASRRPRHPVGWLLLALAVSLDAAGVISGYVPYGLLVRPGALPAAGAIAPYYPVFALAALVCIGFVLLLTPTGSLPSPRWRWWAWVAAAVPAAGSLVLVTLAPDSSASSYRMAANPFEYRAFGGVGLVAIQAALAVTLLAVAVAAGSLVVRFRRARGIERQQLRWVVSAAALVALGAVVGLAASATGATAVVGSLGTQFFIALVPVAIGAAVLQYRLYDLDRIISRALAYGLLTVLLGGGYAAVVLGLGQLLGPSSSLAVAIATLALAGLFQPARRRIQQVVDRRFNRRRYDAARTIEAFSARLRQQVDLDTLTAELLAVVDRTMQPNRASLWLRPPQERSSPASAPAGRRV
jgi:hypothetical protein